MKVRPTVFRVARAAITAAVIFAVASCCIADAQTPATSSDAAVKPSAVPAAQAPGLPHGALEVLKMYQAGIDKNIIIRYVESTALPYHLSADAIIYLQSLGVPQDITKAMIVRDGQLQQQQPVNAPYFPQQPMQGAMPPPYPYGAAGQQPPTQIVTPTTPAPAVDYGDYTDYGAGYVDYGYPYYYGYSGWPYYGYYGWPGWGWGWGGWGGRWGWGGRGWGYGGYRGGYGGFRGGAGGFHGGGGFRGGGGGFHGGAAGGFHGGGMGGGGHGGGGGGHR